MIIAWIIILTVACFLLFYQTSCKPDHKTTKANNTQNKKISSRESLQQLVQANKQQNIASFENNQNQDGHTNNIQENIENIENIDNKDKLQTENENLQKACNEFEAQYNILNNKYQKAKDEIEENNKLIETLKEQLEKKENTEQNVVNENLVEENEKLQRKIQNKQGQIKDQEARIDELTQLSEALKGGNQILMSNIKQLKEINEELHEDIEEIQKAFEKQVKTYQEYIRELSSDIREFEQAYVNIGGDLHDIYEDYDDFI